GFTNQNLVVSQVDTVRFRISAGAGSQGNGLARLRVGRGAGVDSVEACDSGERITEGPTIERAGGIVVDEPGHAGNCDGDSGGVGLARSVAIPKRGRIHSKKARAGFKGKTAGCVSKNPALNGGESTFRPVSSDAY